MLPRRNPTARQPAPRERRPKRHVGSVSLAALAAVLVAAVLGDLAMRTEFASIAAALAYVAAVGALWLSGVVESQRAKLLAGAGVLVVVWLPIRASQVLTTVNVLTAAGLLLAIVVAGDTALPRLIRSEIRNFIERLLGGVLGHRLIAASLPTQGRSHLIAATLRGAALAAVPLLTLAALLVSADAVFASAFNSTFELGPLAGHGLGVTLCVALLLGAICVHRMPAHRADHEPTQRLGAIEALVIVGLVATLFAAFAIAQLITALGGADHILAEQSLTRAEYARTGFFQLLWVAGLTLALLGVIAVAADQAGALATTRRIVNAIVALLTVVIVAVSIIRLRLYTDAFGQTSLRWYCTVFAAMLGVVFVLLAIHYLSTHPVAWFGPATAVVVLATLLFVNLANPDARIAEHNLSRDAGLELDREYLTKLSADAWPIIVENESRIARSTGWSGAAAVVRTRCEDATEPLGYGVLGFNLARSRVECPS